MSTEAEKKSPLADGSALISLMMVLVIAMVLVIGAIGVVAVANGSGGGCATSTTVSVTLTEFKITMEPASVPAGNVVLQIHNAGSAEHNLAAVALNKRVGNIAVGGNATLDLGNVSSAVELICEVPGHKESGMKATLNVGSHDGMVPTRRWP